MIRQKTARWVNDRHAKPDYEPVYPPIATSEGMPMLARYCDHEVVIRTTCRREDRERFNSMFTSIDAGEHGMRGLYYLVGGLNGSSHEKIRLRFEDESTAMLVRLMWG